MIIQGLIESIEENFDHLFLDQGFTELPDGFAIRNLATGFEVQGTS